MLLTPYPNYANDRPAVGPLAGLMGVFPSKAVRARELRGNSGLKETNEPMRFSPLFLPMAAARSNGDYIVHPFGGKKRLHHLVAINRGAVSESRNDRSGGVLMTRSS